MSAPLTHVSRPARVLIVDSDRDNRDLYREALSFDGWDVAEAADGRDALVQLLIRRPSLVLTELRLPIVDGWSLCELVRRDRKTSTVPILVVTSETRPTELARATRAGADTVLIKPSTPDCIISAMDRLLARTPSDARPLPAPSDRRRRLVKAHQRFATTTPTTPALSLCCPACSGPLRYRITYQGGVSSQQPERWDYYDCPSHCGAFQYRMRTRKLRQV
jgi:two-component system cell cycle response regulator DivK